MLLCFFAGAIASAPGAALYTLYIANVLEVTTFIRCLHSSAAVAMYLC